MYTDTTATIDVHFPKQHQESLTTPEKVALFLTDGNSRIRTSRIRSGKTDIIADELLDGRWFTLPISDEEKKKGKENNLSNQTYGARSCNLGASITKKTMKTLNENETYQLEQLLQAKEEFDAGEILRQVGSVSHTDFEKLSLTHFKNTARILDDAINVDESSSQSLKEISALVEAIVPDAKQRIKQACHASETLSPSEIRRIEKKLHPVVHYFESAAHHRLPNKHFSRQTFLQKKREWLFFIALLFAGYIFVEWVNASYFEVSEKVKDAPQPHYASFSNLGITEPAPIYHVEFGRDGKLIKEVTPHEGFSVTLPGFQVGRRWNREVYWYARANSNGTVKINFPLDSITHVALFMTDGNSVWRMSRIQTPGSDYIVDRIHNGRWFLIPVTSQEQSLGTKTIQISQYTGDNIAISALAAFHLNQQNGQR